MMQSFFNGLAGMIMFSRGLDTISNNISNMNTPGFLGSDTFYRALSSGSGGYGVRADNSDIRFSHGEIRETGNATDLAIDGNGYFILRTEDGLRYTRAGQFEFDPDGYLVDKASGYHVLALDAYDNLVDINIDNLLTLNPEATTQVDFSGNLSTGDSDHLIEGLEVFNTLGESIALDYEFTNNSASTPGSWLVEILDSDGNTVGNGEIRFGPDGSPLAGFNTLSIGIPATSNGSANEPLNLTLNFGNDGAFDGATSFAGGTASTLAASIVDGQGVEGVVAASFSNDGTLNLMYSNGESSSPFRLAIANFSDETNLEFVEGTLLSSNTPAAIGYANDGGRGKVQGESLESSNVDLVREFAEMIIVQRGYQASSRVMNISNQLIEQLYDNTRG